ncbi:MAG: hypothetical protein II816_05290 [Elusimicrobia bacterium]|nr:hypothetical protein [Elusimicrobiota bacterium]
MNFIKSNIFFLIVLVVVIGFLYGKSVNFELMDLDDKPSITNSVHYISNIKNLPKIFFQDTTYKHRSTYYRPILMSSFSIETILFGYNTKVYHLTNIVMFIFVVYLIYLFFVKIKLNKNISKLVCLLFAVHPILSSNVVYVSTRAEMLMAIFLLLSFINFINYIETNKIINLILFFMFLLLALLSKETAAMLILILAAFVYAFNYKVSKKQIINVLIFFTLAVITYIVCRFIAIPHPQPSSFATVPIIFINAVNSLMIFVNKIFTPGDIAVLLYDVHITPAMIFVDTLIIAVLIYLFVRKVVDRKKFLFCIFWFVLFLFPNFCIYEQQILFHRLLVPLIGIELFIVLLAEYALNNFPVIKKHLVVLYICVFVSFLFASWFQAEKYRTQNEFMVNSYLDDQNRISSVQFVDFCIQAGDFQRARQLLAERTKDILTYRDILQYAALDLAEGNIDRAEETYLHLEESITYDTIFKNLSNIYLMKKDYDKALSYLKKFKEISQNDIWTVFQETKIYEETGDYKKAYDVLKSVENIYGKDEKYISKLEELKSFAENSQL